MHRKNLNRVVIWICVLVILTGCWDRREIEKQISVIAMALDTHNDGLRLTIQVPIPINIAGSGGGGGGSSGQEAIQLFTATGSNVNDTYKNLQKQMNQELTLGHLRLIIISEELARKGILDLTDALARNAEVRRKLWPLVTKGKAADALKSSPKLEQIPAIFFIEMLENESGRERILEKTFGNVLVDLTDPAKETMINYVLIKENGVNWLGTALFRDYRMVDHLDEEDSWVMMHLRNGKRGSKFTARCPDGQPGKITIEPKTLQRKLTFDEANVAFTINVTLDAVVNEKTCPNVHLHTEATNEKVERLFETEFERRAQTVVKTLQRHQTDVLLLGTHIRAFHPKLWDRINWSDTFSKATIDVRYDVRIKGRGALYR